MTDEHNVGIKAKTNADDGASVPQNPANLKGGGQN